MRAGEPAADSQPINSSGYLRPGAGGRQLSAGGQHGGHGHPGQMRGPGSG